MNLQLAEISRIVSPGKHAVMLLDRAGWYLSGEVALPANITLLPLSAKCPELKEMENIWQFMRDSWLSNQYFQNYDGIFGHCCFYRNYFFDQLWRIMSLGIRDWAHRF